MKDAGTESAIMLADQYGLKVFLKPMSNCRIPCQDTNGDTSMVGDMTQVRR